MTLLIKILVILGILLILRFIVCLNRLIQIKRYHKSYHEYIKKPTFEFNEKKPQIISLFKNAGVTNFVVPRIEPAGFGQLAQMKLDGFANLTLVDTEIITIVEGKFHEAIGIFRHRLLQTTNPIFWIEFVFKLPEYMFDYFGFKSDNVWVKIVQMIYWIIGIIIGLKTLGIINTFKII